MTEFLVYSCCSLGFIICVVGNVLSKKENELVYFTGVLSHCFIIFFTWLAFICFWHNDLNGPSAMDVYSGNTEIQCNCTIYGNDTVYSDSIVVFKKVK